MYYISTGPGFRRKLDGYLLMVPFVSGCLPWSGGGDSPKRKHHWLHETDARTSYRPMVYFGRSSPTFPFTRSKKKTKARTLLRGTAVVFNRDDMSLEDDTGLAKGWHKITNTENGKKSGHVSINFVHSQILRRKPPKTHKNSRKRHDSPRISQLGENLPGSNFSLILFSPFYCSIYWVFFFLICLFKVSFLFKVTT